MSFNWIKMNNNLEVNKKVIYLQANLEIDEDSVLGKLYRLWALADRCTTSGFLECYTKKTLDHYLKVNGICDALEHVDWIKVKETLMNLRRA